MDSCVRDLLNDMVMERFIFKNNESPLSPYLNSYLEQVCAYLKQRLLFTVCLNFSGRKNRGGELVGEMLVSMKATF